MFLPINVRRSYIAIVPDLTSFKPRALHVSSGAPNCPTVRLMAHLLLPGFAYTYQVLPSLLRADLCSFLFSDENDLPPSYAISVERCASIVLQQISWASGEGRPYYTRSTLR